MRRRLTLGLCLGLVVLLRAAPARAERVVIKLGTLAPEGSVWHEGLKELAEKWKEASAGRVQVKVFAGGVAGDETDMVRKMRIGQLNAAALTAVGLHDIEGSPQLLAVPCLLETQAEWQYVYATMAPRFEQRFIDRGFVPLMWADTGWVFLFVDRPVQRLADLRGLKVFAWSGDPGAAEAWRVFGFQPVVISASDLVTSLSTGMVNGFATTPLIAFTARFYERAAYMVDAPWGHLPGATVVSVEAWNRVPAELRPKLIAIAREIGARVDAEAERAAEDSLREMKKRGLKVVQLDAADRKLWSELGQKTWAPLVAQPEAKQVFEQIKQVRDAYRAGRK